MEKKYSYGVLTILLATIVAVVTIVICLNRHVSSKYQTQAVAAAAQLRDIQEIEHITMQEQLLAMLAKPIKLSDGEIQIPEKYLDALTQYCNAKQFHITDQQLQHFMMKYKEATNFLHVKDVSWDGLSDDDKRVLQSIVNHGLSPFHIQIDYINENHLLSVRDENHKVIYQDTPKEMTRAYNGKLAGFILFIIVCNYLAYFVQRNGIRRNRQEVQEKTLIAGR